MVALHDLMAWLDAGNAPEGAADASDLEQAIHGKSQGRYKSESKRGGEFQLITGPGENAFMFNKAARGKQLDQLRSIYQSEPGASLQGDAALERGMSKDD